MVDQLRLQAGWIVTYIDKAHRQLECPLCGEKIIVLKENICNRYCHCKKHTKRFSGKIYENTPEKLAAIKEKYKNGVTDRILEELFI